MISCRSSRLHHCKRTDGGRAGEGTKYWCGVWGRALLIVGGDHAFAAGVYPGTPLERLSPLSSTPPEPTTHWIILLDLSGSMASMASGQPRSRWLSTVDALTSIAPSIPPNDLLSIATFARDLQWSSKAQPARAVSIASLHLNEIAPQGPTNLQSALEQISSQNQSIPTQLLIVSDADAQIDHPGQLARSLLASRVHAHL